MEKKKNNYVQIKFASTIDKQSSDYIYKNTVGAELYDLVLVPTMYGVTIGYVVLVENMTDKQAEDCAKYSKVKETLELIKGVSYFDEFFKSEKIAALKKQMRAKLKLIDEMDQLEYYASRDKSFKVLLDEFKALEGGK